MRTPAYGNFSAFAERDPVPCVLEGAVDHRQRVIAHLLAPAFEKRHVAEDISVRAALRYALAHDEMLSRDVKAGPEPHQLAVVYRVTAVVVARRARTDSDALRVHAAVVVEGSAGCDLHSVASHLARPNPIDDDYRLVVVRQPEGNVLDGEEPP